MDKVYNHKEVEEKLYKQWEEKGYFKPKINPNGKPYSIVLPPPNVTGTLHMGHAFEATIQDVLIRYHRMKGDKTLWLPGTDHAAIATQSKVEAMLYKTEGKTRNQMGREAFLKRVENFAKNSHDTIVNQIRRIGASVDWSKEAYTFDQARNRAVRTAFKAMYDEGLIYRGETIVNWDSKLKTTVSDDEIEWIEEKTPLYYLKYGPFTIATARPETKFGDKYVVMHPDDKRYREFAHGQKIEVEWINGKVTATVIKDESIVMGFGTGVMTITPWHDKTDYEIARRHNLDFEQIIDLSGTLLEKAGEFKGIHIKKARPLIVEKLKDKRLLVKIDENYVHKIATNYRGGGIIEPQIMKQWMVDVNREFILKHSKIKGLDSGSVVTLKRLMKQVVESGQIAITPTHFIKIYYHWIDNLRDWCISRQIWFGHQVPVWYKGDEVYCGVEAPKAEGWKQDKDTLDTWFSSGLWTFSTLGWPNETEDLKTFHPTSVIVPGYEILFFWVARMILMSGFLLGDIPFHDIYLHGIVRDKTGRKFSKSLNNGIDPLAMSEKYGTDALRLALLFGAAAGNDVMFDEDKVRGMKFFANKLWNMARFIQMKKVQSAQLEAQSLEELSFKTNNEQDEEMVRKVGELIKQTNKNITDFRLHEAAGQLYQFIWHEFADKYIESVKSRIDENSSITVYSLFMILIKILHPFMPFVTEEIYQKLGGEGSIMIQPWPQNS